MSPTRPSSPSVRGRRLSRASQLTAAALGVAAITAGPAGAAWTPSVALPFEPEALLTGGPGQAAFTGVNGQDASEVQLHLPGTPTLRPAASPVPPGEFATYGDGGAVAFVVPGAAPTLQFGTLNAAGAYASAGSLPIDPEDPVHAVAADATGSVAVVFSDGDGALHLALGGAGRAVSDRVVSAPDSSVDTADVAPLEGGGHGAVWVESDGTTSVIAGARVGADGVVAPRATLAGDSVPPDAEVFEVHAPAGAAVPTAVWAGTVTDANFVSTTFVRLSVEGPGTRDIVTLPGEVETDVETRAFPSGRVLVSATVAPEDAAAVPVVKVVPPLAGPECVAAAAPLNPASARTAGAIALAGLDPAGRLLRQDVREDCSVAAPAVGPTAPGAVKAAAADAEGSLVVAASDDANLGGAFTVDDRTPPTVGTPRVPSRLAPGERFSASVTASDAWGLDAVSWRLDGRAFDEGTTVSGRAPDPGQHRLEVTATDAAGNRTRTGVDFTVVGDGPGAPGTPPGTGGPGAEVPLPEPSKPRKKQPRDPSDPTVRIRSVQETSRGWVLRLRVRNASRVRLRLYRERYLGAGQVRRRLTCPVRPRPLRRPPSGLRGRTTVVVDGSSVVLRIPRPLADALKKRGRYTLSVVALGTGAKARTASAAANRSFTAC